MTLLIFQHFWLIPASLGCAALAFFTARRNCLRLFWLCCLSVTALVIAALVCMIPYTELVLLLLPSVYAALLGAGRNGS